MIHSVTVFLAILATANALSRASVLKPFSEGNAFKVIADEERIRRHDVMAAIYALEKDAPDAAGIIHIGATSCYGMHYYLLRIYNES